MPRGHSRQLPTTQGLHHAAHRRSPRPRTWRASSVRGGGTRAARARGGRGAWPFGARRHLQSARVPPRRARRPCRRGPVRAQFPTRGAAGCAHGGARARAPRRRDGRRRRSRGGHRRGRGQARAPATPGRPRRGHSRPRERPRTSFAHGEGGNPSLGPVRRRTRRSPLRELLPHVGQSVSALPNSRLVEPLAGRQRVALIGQGYVGLTLAMRAVEVGHSVVGFDVDEERVKRLAAGEPQIGAIEPARITAALASGRYLPTSRLDDCALLEVAVIAVPTPLRDGMPDLSHIESAARSLAPHVRAGSTVILESTTYPGTTEEMLVPILELGSGLAAGVDVSVGY